jgi:hypothetical protein
VGKMPSESYKNILKHYKIGVKNTRDQGIQVVPMEYSHKANKPKPVKFPTDIQEFYDYWLRDCTDTSSSFGNRIARYEDIDYMYYDQTLIFRAANMYADESTQADSQNRTIAVEAKTRSLERKIYDLIDKWGFTQDIIREISLNLCLYGDSFTINATDEKYGITDVSYVDVRKVQKRIEFSASDVERDMIENGGYRALCSQYSNLDKLAKTVQSTTDASKYFKNYLFGYKITDTIFLPPWAVTHFRLFSTRSEFYPYGRPLFINVISTYRQLKSLETMQAMARGAKFPKEVYNVKTSENMNPIDQWNAINEAREEYMNLNQIQTDKEKFGLGGAIWKPQDLLDIDTLEFNYNLDDITDIEYFHEQVALGTGIPISFLIADRGSFGTSGISLTQQYKPFGRSVFRIQNAILNGITEMVINHFILSGEIEKAEDLEFNLLMTYPAVEETRDRTGAKSDSLRLANDIMDSLAQSFGLERGDALPLDITQDILIKNTFLNPEDVEAYFKLYNKGESEKEPIKESTVKKLIECSKNVNKIKEVYFKVLREGNYKEGVMSGKHYYNSNNNINNPMYNLVKDLKNSKKLKD